MTREDIDFIGAMNMCDEISNEAYKKIMVHCEEEQPCTDAISRQAAIDAIVAGEPYDMEYNLKMIRQLPSVRVAKKTWRCKDCKHFVYDEFAIVNGIPIIVAHEICMRWSGGCKTKEDGYCHMFEPKIQEMKE